MRGVFLPSPHPALPGGPRGHPIGMAADEGPPARPQRQEQNQNAPACASALLRTCTRGPVASQLHINPALARALLRLQVGLGSSSALFRPGHATLAEGESLYLCFTARAALPTDDCHAALNMYVTKSVYLARLSRYPIRRTMTDLSHSR